MKRATLMLVALALLLSRGQAKADIIVNQSLSANPTGQFGFFTEGPDSGSGGRQAIANGFSLSAAAQVNEVQWYGAYRFGTIPTGPPVQFLIRFYTDSGGPDTLIIQESPHVTGVPTGLVNSGGLPILAYDTTFSPVSFNAGSTYWIAILEDDAATPFADHWAWQQSDGTGLGASSQSAGTFWSGGEPGPKMAFILSGTSFAAVPEPASVTLLGIGIAGLLGYAWRQRTSDKPWT
jgi:hypothetical protein